MADVVDERTTSAILRAEGRGAGISSPRGLAVFAAARRAGWDRTRVWEWVRDNHDGDVAPTSLGEATDESWDALVAELDRVGVAS